MMKYANNLTVIPHLLRTAALL